MLGLKSESSVLVKTLSARSYGSHLAIPPSRQRTTASSLRKPALATKQDLVLTQPILPKQKDSLTLANPSWS